MWCGFAPHNSAAVASATHFPKSTPDSEVPNRVLFEPALNSIEPAAEEVENTSQLPRSRAPSLRATAPKVGGLPALRGNVALRTARRGAHPVPFQIRLGTPNIGFAATIGAETPEDRPRPSPERSCSSECPADQTSGRLWKIPQINIRWRATPPDTPKSRYNPRTRPRCSPRPTSDAPSPPPARRTASLSPPRSSQRRAPPGHARVDGHWKGQCRWRWRMMSPALGRTCRRCL